MAKIITRNEAFKAARSRKITGPPKEPEPTEHPDDRALRENAERIAGREINGFLATLPTDTLQKLVLTYADARAEELLSNIREHFWALLGNELLDSPRTMSRL